MKNIILCLLLAVPAISAEQPILRSGELFRFTGTVEAMLGSSFGYMPPAPGESFEIELNALPENQLRFGEARNYIPVAAKLEIVSATRYDGREGRLKSVRLISSDETWKVTIDLVDGGSEGMTSKAWILIESRGSIIGVCHLVGRFKSQQAEQDGGGQPATRPESK